MSLQHPFTSGIDTYPTAVTKIILQSSDNKGAATQVTVRLGIYASAAHLTANARPVETQQVRVKLVDLPEASFSGIYTYLKTLPTWSEAVDI